MYEYRAADQLARSMASTGADLLEGVVSLADHGALDSLSSEHGRLAADTKTAATVILALKSLYKNKGLGFGAVIEIAKYRELNKALAKIRDD